MYPTAPSWPTGSQPVALAVGDVDDDGFDDAVVINAGSGDVSILFGAGQGEFEALLRLDVGNEPADLALTDLDGDRDLDIAVVHRVSNDVSVIVNDGKRVFRDDVRYWIGGGPRAVVATDLNGDGLADLVAACELTGSIRVLMNQGQAVYSAAVDIPSGFATRDVAASDLDGDGAVDVVALNKLDETLTIFMGDGDGGLVNASTFTAVAGPDDVAPVAIAIGDISADTIPDLLVIDEVSGFMTFHAGLGDGSFAAGFPYVMGFGPRDLRVVDLDGDGSNDLLAANADDGTVAVFLDPAVDFLPTWDERRGEPLYVAAGRFPMAISTLDANGDGLLDILAIDRDQDRLVLLQATVDGSFAVEPRFPVGPLPIAVAPADFDGDGLVDLAVANFGGQTISVLAGGGDGTFGSASDHQVGVSPSGLDVADFNGDGILDLAATNDGTQDISVLLGLGGAGFAAEMRYALPSSGASFTFPGQFSSGDFDADGDVDLAVARSLADGSSDLVILRNDGSALFGIEVLDTFGSNAGGRCEVADVDGVDGDEIVFTTSAGLYQIYSDVAGTTGLYGLLSSSVVADLFLSGDVEQDGDGDIVTLVRFPIQFQHVSNYWSRLFVDVNSGADDPFADDPRVLPHAFSPFDAILHDLDLDGDLDLAMSHGLSDSVTVMMNDGDGNFSPPNRFPAGNGSTGVAAADVNNDGAPDLIVTNARDDSVSILLSQSGANAGVEIGGLLASWGPCAGCVYDLNGDGVVDFADLLILLATGG